jgi:hypothetical protein
MFHPLFWVPSLEECVRVTQREANESALYDEAAAYRSLDGQHSCRRSRHGIPGSQFPWALLLSPQGPKERLGGRDRNDSAARADASRTRPSSVSRPHFAHRRAWTGRYRCSRRHRAVRIPTQRRISRLDGFLTQTLRRWVRSGRGASFPQRSPRLFNFRRTPPKSTQSLLSGFAQDRFQ